VSCHASRALTTQWVVNRLTIVNNFTLTVNYDGSKFSRGYPAVAD
jgi:hypothetical protein